jgi:hypothetical protein
LAMRLCHLRIRTKTFGYQAQNHLYCDCAMLCKTKCCWHGESSEVCRRLMRRAEGNLVYSPPVLLQSLLK